METQWMNIGIFLAQKSLEVNTSSVLVYSNVDDNFKRYI